MRIRRVAVVLVMVALLGPLWAGRPSLRAQEEPVLQVSPTSLSFAGQAGGKRPKPQFLTLTNAGGGLLHWTASENLGWLKLSDTKGNLDAGQSEKVTVTVDVSGLDVSNNKGQIIVFASGTRNSPTFVDVSLILTGLPTTVLQLIGASDYHARGITGQGVKVGVIDLGFAGLQETIEAGELPPNVKAWNCLGSSLPAGTRPGCRAVSPAELGAASSNQVHGTSPAEIVHDVAPDAELWLFLVNTEVELGQALLQALDEGVQIINHSVGWFNDDFYDCRGLVGTIVRDARQNGIFWVNAAGNFALSHYESPFQDKDGDGYHDPDLTVELEKDQTLLAFLTWDAWPKTTENFDLFLERDQKIEASSTALQNGTEPVERLKFSLESQLDQDVYQLRIKWAGDGPPPANRKMELFVLGSGRLKIRPDVPASSLPEPANCAEAFVVGAVQPLSLEIEPYSSQGPSNLGINKPDLVAPDCVRTFSFRSAQSAAVCGKDGLLPGTGAAAPFATGAAALLLAEDPSRNVEDLVRILRERAIPKGDPNVYGAGILNLRPLP